MKEAEIEHQVHERLREVVDPETGLDVVTMGVMKKISAGPDGSVELLFVPSSPACPLAFKLALDIRDAARSVKGVTKVKIDVDGYWRAEELKRVLEEE
ncbi:MAG: iron-sulfur cluster assembly protein [Candidatus Tritonobacter lacicola]|nr:iron-sulfur cluster assembly protein [Candidatus Tritonobacter lacicola]